VEVCLERRKTATEGPAIDTRKSSRGFPEGSERSWVWKAGCGALPKARTAALGGLRAKKSMALFQHFSTFPRRWLGPSVEPLPSFLQQHQPLTPADDIDDSVSVGRRVTPVRRRRTNRSRQTGTDSYNRSKWQVFRRRSRFPACRFRSLERRTWSDRQASERNSEAIRQPLTAPGRRESRPGNDTCV